MSETKILERVRGLLAKAESSTFEAEAEAFFAKAEALMAQHAIDSAMLSGADGATFTSTIVHLDDPYAVAKHHLLHAVATNTNCRAIGVHRSRRQNGKGKDITIYGRAEDIEVVEALYTSLEMHAARTMMAARPIGNTRSFRQSFLLAFAQRIHERMSEARAVAKDAAQANVAQGGESVGLVLARQDAALDAFIASQAEGRITNSRASYSATHGADAGRRSADSADIGQRRVGGNVRAIGAGA